MSGVELIVAALAAGAGAGIADTATASVRDSYHALVGALRNRFAGRPSAEFDLSANEVDTPSWQARMGSHVAETGADRDEVVLAASRRVLDAVRESGAGSGPAVNVTRIDNAANYGASAGLISGPVTINYGGVPVPPVAPEAD